MSAPVKTEDGHGSTQAAFNRVEIPKDAILNGENYTDWRDLMMSIFEQHGLDGTIVHGKPDNTGCAKAARTFLLFSMDRCHRDKTRHCKTAFELWSAISSIYEVDCTRIINKLYSDLFTIKAKSLEDVSPTLSKLQTIMSQLKDHKETISVKLQNGCIEAALPDDFDDWRKLWSVRDKDPTLNELLGAIEKHLSILKSMKKPESSALVATAQPHKNNKICRYCKNSGHEINECRKLQARRMQQGMLPSSQQPPPTSPGQSSANYQTQQRPSPTNHVSNGKLNYRQQGATRNEVSHVAVMDDEHFDFEVTYMAVDNHVESTAWIADSGCSLHMTNNIAWIHDYRQLIQPINIKLGDNRIIQAIGKGTIRTKQGNLNNVHLVPQIKHNLLSISSAADKGLKIITNSESMQFFDKKGLLVNEAKRQGKCYVMAFDIVLPNVENCAAATIEQWHQRYAHISKDTIKRMVSTQAVLGLDIKPNQLTTCEDCALNKCTRAHHPSRTSPRAAKPGLSIHVDTAGPINPTGVGLNSYIVVCKDEHSGYRMVKCVPNKSMIADRVKEIINEVELETGNNVLKITSDNGTEYINQSLSSFFSQKGIIHQRSVKYVPQQNGTAEREVRTLVEAARTLLNASSLPTTLWPEAVYTASYVLNRSLPSNQTTTPFELWHGKKPNVKNLRTFGQHAVVLRDKHGAKFDEKGAKMIFVGYTNFFNTYRFCNQEMTRIETSCNATFLDGIGPITTKDSPPTNNSQEDSHSATILNVPEPHPTTPRTSTPSTSPIIQHIGDNTSSTFHSPSSSLKSISLMEEPDTGGPTQDETMTSNPTSIMNKSSSLSHLADLQSSLQDRGLRQKSRIDYRAMHLGKEDLTAMIAQLDTVDPPRTYKEAITGPFQDVWAQAMNSEIDSMIENQVFEIVPRPFEHNVVGCRWVFSIKTDPNGLTKAKARLVAQGFTQQSGVDYFSTYAPVIPLDFIRFFFAVAAHSRLNIRQFDVQTAFLNGKLNETIYMRQPEGFSTGDNVWLLKRSLYGLKQSPKMWNDCLTQFLTKLGLTQSSTDDCIFFRLKPLIILIIYVDDGIIFASEDTDIDAIMDQLSNRFKINVINNNRFIGLQYNQHRDGTITLHQQDYIHRMLTRFGMNEANPSTTPMVTGQEDGNTQPISASYPFREAVGALQYAATQTRPDIAFAVGFLARKVTHPSSQDEQIIKRIFRYLKSTSNFGLTYKPNSLTLTAFADADFAGDPLSRRSTTGNIIMCGDCPISWRSKLQRSATTSTTEAEYLALTSTIKQIQVIRQLAIELKISNSEPTPLKCDNRGAVLIVNHEASAQRTRHLGAQLNYAREHHSKGTVRVESIPANEQLADILTKPLPKQKFITARDKIMTALILCVALSTCNTLTSSQTSTPFQSASFIVWSQTDDILDKGIIEYDAVVGHQNPCFNLARTLQGFPDNTSIAARLFAEPLKTCEKCRARRDVIMQAYFQTAMDKRQRLPRFIPILVVWGIGALIAGGTPLAFTVAWQLCYAYSTYNQVVINKDKIGNLTLDLQVVRDKLSESENSHRHAAVALENQINANLRNTQSLNEIIQLVPALSSMTTEAQSRCSDQIEAFNELNEALRKGHVSMRALARLSGLEAFHQIDSLKTRFLHVRPHREFKDVSVFRFLAPKIDKSISIWKANPFHKWEKKGDEYIFKHYVGPQYAIFNLTNNCTKMTHDPIGGAILETCDRTEDGIKEMVEQAWRQQELSPAEIKFYRRPKIIRSIHYNHIYCPFDNITIYNQSYPCPDQPFKLNHSIPFEVSNISSSYELKSMIADELEDQSQVKIELIPHQPDASYFQSVNAVKMMKASTDQMASHHNYSLFNHQFNVPETIGGVSTFSIIIVIIIMLYLKLQGRSPISKVMEATALSQMTRSVSQQSITPPGPSINININNGGPSAPTDLERLYPSMSSFHNSGRSSASEGDIYNARKHKPFYRPPTPGPASRRTPISSLVRTASDLAMTSLSSLKQSFEWSFGKPSSRLSKTPSTNTLSRIGSSIGQFKMIPKFVSKSLTSLTGMMLPPTLAKELTYRLPQETTRRQAPQQPRTKAPKLPKNPPPILRKPKIQTTYDL